MKEGLFTRIPRFMFHRKFKPNVPQIAAWNKFGHLIAAIATFLH